MLVLSRRPGQSILIGKDIEVVILGSDGVQVRVGIRAPREVTVLRRELLKQVEEENKRASVAHLGASVASLGAALGARGGLTVPAPEPDHETVPAQVPEAGAA